MTTFLGLREQEKPHFLSTAQISIKPRVILDLTLITRTSWPKHKARAGLSERLIILPSRKIATRIIRRCGRWSIGSIIMATQWSPK